MVKVVPKGLWAVAAVLLYAGMLGAWVRAPGSGHVGRDAWDGAFGWDLAAV